MRVSFFRSLFPLRSTQPDVCLHKTREYQEGNTSDSRENPEEFPQSFPRGVCSGIYWAYVTMTTVGYGDLTPKLTPARLFAMVWMIVGLISLSLLSAKLTTALTVPQAKDTKLYGQEIAAIYDSAARTIAIHHSAKVNIKALYRTMKDIADSLKRRKVRSALVDVASAAARPDLFVHPDIDAIDIKHPFSFGFILSRARDMANAASTFKDYIKVGQGTTHITHLDTYNCWCQGKERGRSITLIHQCTIPHVPINRCHCYFASFNCCWLLPKKVQIQSISRKRPKTCCL